MLQIAGMKLETDSAPPPQRHSAPTAATGDTEGPVPKHVTAALRQSAPAVKVSSHTFLLVPDMWLMPIHLIVRNSIRCGATICTLL